MARKTDGEKIDELQLGLATLTERVDNLLSQVMRLPALETKVALLEQQVADLKKSQEKWGNRLWMIPAPLLAAVIGSLLTFWLKSPH